MPKITKRCLRCGKEFETFPYLKKKYCSVICGLYANWEIRIHTSKKWVHPDELRRLYEEEDLTVVQIAKRLKLDPATVYRRLKKYSILTRSGTRIVSVPQGNVTFVLSLSPVHSADLYRALKILKTQFPFPFSLKTYDSTYRETIKEVRKSKSDSEH